MINKTDLIDGSVYVINGHRYKYNGVDGGNKPTFVICGDIQDKPKGVPGMYVFQKHIDRLPITLSN